MEKTFSITEVAKIMGMTLKVVRRFVASGELKTTKKNNTYSVSEEDLEAFKKYIEDGEHQKHAQEVADSFKHAEQGDLFGGTEYAAQDIVTKKGDIVNWADINQYWDNPTKSEMTFVDLFCGAGGLSKGLEMSGLEGICGLDWFNEACMTYNRNFDHPFINGDIKDPENKKKF